MFRHFFRFSYLLCLLLSIVGASASGQVNAQSNNVEVLSVDGIIVPAVFGYIDRGIRDAETKGSAVCIIELDTPGGLLDTTVDIVERLLTADVPTVVYVSPSGAWAASAGTFITIAGHIAVMSPGTSIGAATPVSGEGQELPEDVARKATEFSVASIRSIAEQRGRNLDEAELAIREAKSFTATEALEVNLVDFIANNLDDLIDKLDGMSVILQDGTEKVIDTKNAVITINEMNFMEEFLHVISNPNIAFLLMSIATIGIITEISNPGLIFPGVIGGLSLLLAFYSLGTLNAQWAGIGLIIFAFILFIIEIFTPTFGILSAGGLVSLVIGAFILFSDNVPALQISPGLIIGVAIVLAAFLFFVVRLIVKSQRKSVVTGVEGLVGKIGTAQTKLEPKGTVLVEGEHWSATVERGKVKPGENVEVVGVDGLKIQVRKIQT